MAPLCAGAGGEWVSAGGVGGYGGWVCVAGRGGGGGATTWPLHTVT